MLLKLRRCADTHDGAVHSIALTTQTAWQWMMAHAGRTQVTCVHHRCEGASSSQYTVAAAHSSSTQQQHTAAVANAHLWVHTVLARVHQRDVCEQMRVVQCFDITCCDTQGRGCSLLASVVAALREGTGTGRITCHTTGRSACTTLSRVRCGFAAAGRFAGGQTAFVLAVAISLVQALELPQVVCNLHHDAVHILSSLVVVHIAAVHIHHAHTPTCSQYKWEQSSVQGSEPQSEAHVEGAARHRDSCELTEAPHRLWVAAVLPCDLIVNETVPLLVRKHQAKDIAFLNGDQDQLCSVHDTNQPGATDSKCQVCTHCSQSAVRSNNNSHVVTLVVLTTRGAASSTLKYSSMCVQQPLAMRASFCLTVHISGVIGGREASMCDCSLHHCCAILNAATTLSLPVIVDAISNTRLHFHEQQGNAACCLHK